MNSLVEKLASRKLIAVLVASVITILGNELGLSEEVVFSILGITSAFILGQSIEDYKAPARRLAEKFRSRKWWVFVALTVATTVSEHLGIDPKVIALLSTYFIGQGVADLGRWKSMVNSYRYR